MVANESTSLTVGPYTVRFVIVGIPHDGRGGIRVTWGGQNLTAGSVSGAFDAATVASISGEMKASAGTLSYHCGALGKA